MIDGLGNPIDDKGPLHVEEESHLCHAGQIYDTAANPQTTGYGNQKYQRLADLRTGAACGYHGRFCVGKSTLLGMIARYTEADINVIALIGERGRELREFIEKDLQEEGLKKSVVVVATSDQPPWCVCGAHILPPHCGIFSAAGQKGVADDGFGDAFCHGHARSGGWHIGEPPTTKGYTPSVFAALPKLLERTGNFSEGSITGLYTVLGGRR